MYHETIETVFANLPKHAIGLFVTTITITTLIITRCFSFFVQDKDRSNSKSCYPPYAPYGILQTIHSITSSDSPWFFLRSARRVGYVFRIRLPLPGRPMVVAVGDAKAAREILLDPASTKPYGVYRPGILGPTIFNSEGWRWRHARKGVMPAFSSRHVERMNNVCMQKTEEWIRNKLDPKIDKGESFDVGYELTKLTMFIICEAAFEYKATDEEVDMFTSNLEISLKSRQKTGMNPIRRKLGAMLPSVRRAKSAAMHLADFGLKIMKHYRDNTALNPPSNNSSRNKAGDSVISLIVNNTNYANDMARAVDINIFLVAGHDTTSYSLSWTLLELARNPIELKRLRSKLINVPMEDWAKSTPLRNVMREGMRLHPVAAVGSIRTIKRDVTIKTTNNSPSMFIPQGATVFLPQILLNRNEAYYEQPDIFMPSRWEEGGDTSDQASAAFMPFSLGRRNCVGQSLANAELHSVLARLLRDYDFEVEDDGTVDYFVTMKPKGARLIARKRDENIFIETKE